MLTFRVFLTGPSSRSGNSFPVSRGWTPGPAHVKQLTIGLSQRSFFCSDLKEVEEEEEEEEEEEAAAAIVFPMATPRFHGACVQGSR